MWRELRISRAPRSMRRRKRWPNADYDKDGSRSPAARRARRFAQAAWQIVIADVSMSLDNVLAVAGAARDHPTVLVIGLGPVDRADGYRGDHSSRGCSHRYRWIAYVGLLIILYVALDMIWTARSTSSGQFGFLSGWFGGMHQAH